MNNYIYIVYLFYFSMLKSNVMASAFSAALSCYFYVVYSVEEA